MNRQSLTFVALRSVAVNDRTCVVTAYSLQCGRVAFAIPAGAGRSAMRLRALLQPLGVCEGIAVRRGTSDLLSLSQVQPVLAPSGIYGHPVRCTVGVFVAELLCGTLRDTQPDAPLFAFVTSAIERLNSASGRAAANFHICFLMHLAGMLGVAPDWDSFSPGLVLDLDEGRYEPAPPPDHRLLNHDDSHGAWMLSRMTFDNLGAFRLSRESRNRAIDMMVDYISAHYAPLGTIRSLEVLRSLF